MIASLVARGMIYSVAVQATIAFMVVLAMTNSQAPMVTTACLEAEVTTICQAITEMISLLEVPVKISWMVERVGIG